MKKCLYHFIPIFCLAGAINATLWAQPFMSVEAQGYPTGIITTAIFGMQTCQKTCYYIRAGYNYTDRKSAGKQINERGGGPGFGIGLDNTIITKNLRFGFRADLWRMKIDYRQNSSTETTRITMIQPTALLSWQLIPNIYVSASFGWEFNIRTQGEPVGEGSILLIGLGVPLF